MANRHTNQLTIVTYHYVRDVENTPYPELKVLLVKKFLNQLDFFAQKKYQFITMEALLAAASGNETLPKQAMLLTFDDGYREHFETVYPALMQRGIQGSFSPVVEASIGHRVLDVNKIQFILASTLDTQQLITELYLFLDINREEYRLKSNIYYYQKFATKDRFDSVNIMFVKAMLQKVLPKKLRHTIIDALFRKYVTANETAFATKLYLSESQIKTMKKGGMHIGSHSYSHQWMDTLSASELADEIEQSISFIKRISGTEKNWTMCYPYGAYNNKMLALLRKHGCVAGVTTEPRIAEIGTDDMLILPRLDTTVFKS